MWVFSLVLACMSVALATATAASSSSSSGCQWMADAPSAELRCQLRTLQSAEWRMQMESVAHPDVAQSLKIECSDVLFFESALEREILVRMPRLRSLSIAWCKVREIQSGSLAALMELRTLSIRTHNTDWPAMALTLTEDSLAGLKELRDLDLSDNSLISTPEGLFCSLDSLSVLNLSSNRLQDVATLGFRTEEDCLQELNELDLSFNAITELHPLSFKALRKLESLSLHHNGMTHLADQSLAHLQSLRMLNLSSNQLSVLPPELFRDCHDLRELDLHANALKVLPLGSFAGLTQLQVLDLSSNQLGPAAVHRDTLAGLVRLVVLNLGGNALTRLDSALFRDLASLQVLRLDSNLIESVDADAFLPLLNLHTLDLSHNRISVVDERLLGGLYVLSSLSMSFNEIRSVSADAFRNVTGLRDLDLSGNRLSQVPSALMELALLKSLDLSSNRIRNISASRSSGGLVGSSGVPAGASVQVGWGQLYSLNLANNDIRSVSKDALTGLNNLVALNLAANKIEQLETGCFDRASGLQVLRLDGNQMTDINGLFQGLHNLRWLNISANKIVLFDYSFLPAGIEWLDIHQNRISRLTNYYQIHLPNLQAIDASFNLLEELFQDSIPDSVVQLFVNNNRIASIGANMFLKKANLSRVELNSNALRNLDPAALWLSPVPADRELPEFSLGDNPWQCDCDLEWLPQLVQPSSTSRQQPRLVDAADMTCTLSFRASKTLAGSNATATDRGDLVPIVDVRPEEFLCPYRTHCFALCHCCEFDACDCEMTCPTGCSCYHDPTWWANIVDCSAGNSGNSGNSGDVGSELSSVHTGLPDGIPMDVTELHLDGNNLTELSSHAFIGRKIMHTLYLNASRIQVLRNRTFHGLGSLQVLHLESNLLEEIRGSEFEALDHLKRLYLQDNRIRWIGDTAFIHLRALEVLRIDGNGLVSFPMWRLGVNPHLKSLSLSANPWSCDCRFLNEFQQWVETHPHRVVDASDMQCLLDSFQRPIALEDLNQTCAESGNPGTLVIRQMASVMDYLPLLVAAGVLVVIIVATLVLAAMYRQTVRIWIFSRYKIRLCDSTDAHLDETPASGRKQHNETFDAFLSYSLKDEQFVSQILAAELEHGAESLRLCLQHRDFASSNMSGSSSGSGGDPLTLGLAASRRIILVISQSFIESEWTRPEVRSALTGFLRKPRTRIVAVLLTSQWADEADPELNLVLASSIRIRWGERNFWPKLRYYLPDPTPRHYIRNLHSAGSGLWYQTNTPTKADARTGSMNKRTMPHPLPVEEKSKNAELYWEIGCNGTHPGVPRRYTSTPQQGYSSGCPADAVSVYSGCQSYSRLEHSYMSIDHGHEHIYSSVQDPHETHPHHPDCWSYRTRCQLQHQQHQQHQQQLQHQQMQHQQQQPNISGFLQPEYPTLHHSAPRPPVQQPQFRMNPQPQQPQQHQQLQHSTFLV